MIDPNDVSGVHRQRRGFGAMVVAMAVWAGDVSVARSQDAPLTVEVTGVRSNQGVVRVDVCTAATFLKETCTVFAAAPAVMGTTSVTVEALPQGVYAVQAYHDLNDNDQLDRGPFGFPREDLGFSNDAPLGLNGPSFGRASFVHGAEAQIITLRLRHFAGRGAVTSGGADQTPTRPASAR
jgi:uncharacterized protein (DUF2141 family)